jgi:hypothetical protein
MDYWTLFGTSNQLLAALSLLGITVWLYHARRPVWYTLAPTLFVLVITVWSLLLQARGSLRTIVAGGLRFDPVAINGVVSLVLCGLAAALVWEAWRVVMRSRTRRPGARGAVAASVLAALALAALAPRPAAAQTSRNVTFLSQFHPDVLYASCWGWTSPGGQELAILGGNNGTYIVDVSMASMPMQLAHIPGPTSQWREMKTWDHYAYVVTENLGINQGMQIIDLATSPPTLVVAYEGVFNRAHTITIDGPWAYARASTTRRRGFAS